MMVVVDSGQVPVLPPGLPEDWAFERDLECPRCRYNLRMLHLPRCPECGTVFRWQALLHVGCPRCGQSLRETDDAQCPRCALPLNWVRLLGEIDPARLRQYEYTRRPRGAAFRAWFSALRPRRFWARIHLESPPVVHRLRWLRRVSFILAVLGLEAPHVINGLPHLYHWPGPFGIALILPVVTLFALPRFTPTLARFRVRSDQLLRVTCYATTGLAWIGLIHFIGLGLAVLIDALLRGGGIIGMFWWDPYFSLDPFFEFVLDDAWKMLLYGWWMDYEPPQYFDIVFGGLLFALAFVWWWCFLFVALRCYLRLDRKNALALLVSTQAMGLLILALWMLYFAVPYSRPLQRFLAR